MKENNRPARRKGHVYSGTPATKKPRTMLLWILAAMTVVAAGFGLVGWTKAQAVGQAQPVQPLRPEDEPEPPMTPERELARLAILEPVAFEQAVAPLKTPQDIQAEQIAIFAITQPQAYAAEFERFKDAARRQKEQAARAAILDPVGHSGPVPKNSKTPPTPVGRP